jgi:diguanylate cyclase (GGDEF)-like protein
MEVFDMKYEKLEIDTSQFIDKLTECYKENFFFESGKQILQVALRNKVPLSICVIEIDDFEILNEMYGDIFSAEILKWITDIIRRKCRKSDLLGRLGVKEFGLLMYNTSAINAQMFLDLIRKEVEIHGYSFNKERIQETLSMGISLYSPIMDGETLEPMYERAKTALSRAKVKGKNCVVTY